MGKIFEIVPRSRRYASDFKCSSPGEDEASLLLELAKLARCEVEYLDRRLPGHDVVLFARARQGRMKLTMQREKYAFPPVAILRYLNGVLCDERVTRRLVACRDGVPWEAGNDGEVVVLIDDDEQRQLRSAGVEIYEDDENDARFRVEPVRTKR